MISKTSLAKDRCALALLVKMILPGAEVSRTKLSTQLSESEVSALQNCFLRDAVSNMSRIVDAGLAEGVILFSPAGAEQTVREIAPRNFKLFPQRGTMLGEVLNNATSDLLQRGFTSICLLNYESPTLPSSLIEAAIGMVSAPTDRLILSVAERGGYCLIACRDSYPKLFERITSSSSNFVTHAMTRGAELGLKIEMFPSWYTIEDKESLKRLFDELLGKGKHASSTSRPDKPHFAPFTQQYLAKLMDGEGAGRFG